METFDEVLTRVSEQTKRGVADSAVATFEAQVAREHGHLNIEERRQIAAASDALRASIAPVTKALDEADAKAAKEKEAAAKAKPSP